MQFVQPLESLELGRDRDREAALITFLVTASGMSLFGLSAAFWGLIFGLAAHAVLTLRRPRAGPAGAEPVQTRN